jgi:hypothetical protein
MKGENRLCLDIRDSALKIIDKIQAAQEQVDGRSNDKKDRAIFVWVS